MGAIANLTRASWKGQALSLFNQNATWVVLIAAALVLSRWVLFPEFLTTFDQINFALAIEHFDPRLHQPQPPGYPVFVALLKLLSFLGITIEAMFLVAALALSGLALVLMWLLCERVVGPGYGVVGALLLLFNPAFWLAAITNPVRLCLAAGALAVALCVWRACQANDSRWLIAAAAVLGICMGARPTLGPLLTPLILWAAWRTKAQWRTIALAGLFFWLAVATWLPALLHASGGLAAFLHLLQEYSTQQMSTTSPLFGARLENTMMMAWKGIAWTGLGALSWLWAAPFVRRTGFSFLTGPVPTLLLLWAIPELVSFTVLHVADPDHTLSVVPATCVCGALVLRAFTRRLSPVWGTAVIAICVLLNAGLFLKPISKLTTASNYRAVRYAATQITTIMTTINRLSAKGPVYAVFDETTTGWRQLSYYEPRTRIIVLLGPRGGPRTARVITGRHVTHHPIKNGHVQLPACGVAAWVDFFQRPALSGPVPLESVNSRVYFTPSAPGMSAEFRGVRFTSDAPCNEI